MTKLHSAVGRVAFVACAAGWAASIAAAQPSGERASDNLLQQQRAIDARREEQRREQAPLNSLLDWQWGGWIDYYVFHFDDGVQSQRVLQSPSLSAWSRLTIDDGAHELFARLKLQYDHFDHGDEFDRRSDWVGPDFDRAWYEIDIGRALHLASRDEPSGMRVRIGRQEVMFGTGYVLDQPLDAVVFDANALDWRLTGSVGRAIGSTPNLDRSDPVDTHSARRFFGVQATYEGLANHRPFAYAIWNDDYVDERPVDPLQSYAYDTQYYGVGSRGSIISNLNYWSEFAFETGDSSGTGDFYRRDRVGSWAWDFGVEKLYNVPSKPHVALEYMFASGDVNRIYNPTSATGGNGRNSEDTSFAGFGFRDTGISAGFVNSNVHIWRMGGGFRPFESAELFENMELGTNWFLYHKHHSRAALSDSTADEFEGYAGWEMDYYVNWRLSSDLAWTIRWGMFFPGDAFSDRSSRSFLLTGLTWSF